MLSTRGKYKLSVQPQVKRRNGKLKKRFIRVLAATLTEAGWLSLMYNLWIMPNQFGTFLSILCIFAGDYLAIFED